MSTRASAGPTNRSRPDTGRHYGKYRGIVTTNEDPRKIGRVRARVSEILGEVETGWALPCAPYAGKQTGLHAVPPEGAGVWIEFEAGRVSRPIWSGCWWRGDELPTDEEGSAVTPDVKITRSEEGLMLALHDDTQTIALSDSDGKNILRIEVKDGVVTLKASSKVVVDAPEIELVSGASHAGVLGDKLKSFLSELVSKLNSHTHSGQQAGPYPVTPMPPGSPLSPPSQDILSTKVKLG